MIWAKRENMLFGEESDKYKEFEWYEDREMKDIGTS